MTRIRTMNPSLLEHLIDPATGRPYQWTAAENIFGADISAGARLWSPDAGFIDSDAYADNLSGAWTPATLPDGLTKAVRLSPSPLVPLAARSQRPRSQLDMDPKELVSAEAVAAGVDPAEKANGQYGTKRAWVDYICLDPTRFFISHTPNFSLANTILFDQHGASGTPGPGTPNFNINVQRVPTDADPMHLTCTVSGGRTIREDKVAGWTGSSGDYSSPPGPAWPYDTRTNGRVGDPYYTFGNGQRRQLTTFTEVRRIFDLLDGAEVELGHWYRIVSFFWHGWDVSGDDGFGTHLEVWVDGVKRIGPGTTPVRYPIDTANRLPSIDAYPDSFTTFPTLYKDMDTGFVQQSPGKIAMYVPVEGPEPAGVDPADSIWNRAVWRTGNEIFDTLAEAQPSKVPSVSAPVATITWDVIAPASSKTFAADPVDLSWPVVDDFVQVTPERTWAVYQESVPVRATLAARTADGDWSTLR